MKQSALFIFLLFFLISCEKNNSLLNSRATLTDGIETVFELRDVSGLPAREFQVGDSIRFCCQMINRSGKEQGWMKPDSRPFVTYEIYKNDSLVWNSTWGFGFYLAIVQDTLEDGQRMERSLFFGVTDSLTPPGNYRAVAEPETRFEDFDLSNLQIEFVVAEINR